MFELFSDGLAALQALADPATPGIEQVRAAERLRAIADAAQARAITGLAEGVGWTGEGMGTEYDEIGRRLVRIGADGTPLIDETLPLEIAAARHTSVGSATLLIRDLVNLKTRNPETWQAAQEGLVPQWQAQRIAQACVSFGLDHAESAQVEHIVNRSLGHVGYGRLMNLVRATIMQVAPDKVRQLSQFTQARYVATRPDHLDAGTTRLEAAIDTADAVFLDATIDRLADLLGEQGDDRVKDHRRAAALGMLATPAVALSMLGAQTGPKITAQIAATALPTTQVFVHLGPDALDDDGGVARVEKIGPALVERLGQILGHSRIRLTPVIHVGGPEPLVDAYEIPQSIREQVIQRDAWEVFPYSSRPARNQDLDHTVPYRPGRPGQTRPSNLGPLSRRVHRAKTHAHFDLVQTEPGVFWWRTGEGQVFRIGPDGTTDYSDTS